MADSVFTANTAGRGADGFSSGTTASDADPGGAGGAIAFTAGTGEVSASTFSANRAGEGGTGGVFGGRAGAGRLTSLRLAPAAFRVSGKPPLGTSVSFRLSVASRLVLTVRKPAAGRRSGRRCVALRARLEGAKRCRRTLTLPGKLRRSGGAGLNVLPFSGRLGGKALRPGPYTLVVSLPRAGAQKAVSLSRGFRIMR